MAAVSLRAGALRSALAVLGIVIGVGAVVLTVGLGVGAQDEIRRQIEALGTNFVSLNSGPPRAPGTTPMFLVREDAEAIRAECAAVADVVPVQETRLTVAAGSAVLDSTFVMGTTATYPRLRRAALAAGRFFDDEEERSAARVAVLGANVARSVIGEAEAVGAEIRIHGQHFVVAGVLAEKGEAGLGPGVGVDDRVFVPLRTLEKRVSGARTLRAIFVEAVSADAVDEARHQVRALMDRRHPGNPFELRSQRELLATASGVGGVLTLLLATVAGISLVVGGIGVMNLMLVAVSERTREIGVRKALGATRRAILSQFLMEAVALSLVGGIAGLAFGAGTCVAGQAWLGWPMRVVPEAMALAVGCAAAAGISFGVYPAWRAARLSPMVALKAE